MLKNTFIALAISMLFIVRQATGQQFANAEVIERLDNEGSVTLLSQRATLLKYDYKIDGRNVEAIVFRPVAEGKYPGVLLVPGFSKTARDYIPLALRFVREGFAVIAITQTGFGNSEGEPDFVGPKTIASLKLGLDKFRNEFYVDSNRIGALGYSRGAIAVSIMATSGVDMDAAILAGGIYDLEKAYAEIQIEGIKANIEKEAGKSKEEFVLRSSLNQMDKLNCPVLILHGAKDINAPISQAKMLKSKLEQDKKQFEIKIFEDSKHSIGMQNLLDSSLPFFQKYLKN